MGYRSITLIDADSIAYRASASKTVEELHGTVDKIIHDCLLATDFDRLQDALCIFVEPEASNNFRRHVAVLKPYKGERYDKPEWVVPAKDYMCERWNAERVIGMESEDRLSITARTFNNPETTYVCGIDKDLQQIPANHYNYNEKFSFRVTPQGAELMLWAQILAGDSRDNVKGIAKMGVPTAKKLLNETPQLSYAARTACIYKQEGYSYRYFLEMARLVYLLRHENDVFQLPWTEEQYESDDFVTAIQTESETALEQELDQLEDDVQETINRNVMDSMEDDIPF